MLRGRRFVVTAGALLVGVALLGWPARGWAQRGSGHSSGLGGLSAYGRPDGVDQKDTLSDFHHAMAVQATSKQVAQFQLMVKNTETAKTKLEDFLENEKNIQNKGIREAEKSLPDALSSALQQVRDGNKFFQQGFSEPQVSGLKEITKRLDHADFDLQQETTRLAQSLQAGAPQTDVLLRTESLSKSLSDFSDEQSALGREMSIVLANGQDLTFMLPRMNSPVHVANQTLNVGVSGILSQTAAVQDGRRTFKLDLEEDLSDVQQNITTLMRIALQHGSDCGERISVRQAMLTPATPATLVLVQLHYERWACVRMYGQTSQNELAENDGSVEVKLTPQIVEGNLRLAAQVDKVTAEGMLADALKSGDLADDLPKEIAAALLPAARAGMNFKTSLPAALENSARVQTAEFHDAGAGVLRVVLEGQAQISNEQANLLANQLNQALAAKADVGAADTSPVQKTSSQ